MNTRSRKARNTATLIDNIFTNSINKQTTSGIIVTDIRVHFPVLTLCEYAVTERNLTYIYIYIYKKPCNQNKNFICRIFKK